MGLRSISRTGLRVSKKNGKERNLSDLTHISIVAITLPFSRWVTVTAKIPVQAGCGGGCRETRQ